MTAEATAPPTGGQPEPAHLLSRAPAQAVIGALLQAQAGVRPRSRLMRVLGRTPLSAESAPWYTGALGEVAVGRLLARLGPEWQVLHAVPVGRNGADIDHVVIGPGGVWTVNTKHHRGQSVWVAGRNVRVAGQPQHHVRNAEHEAGRAAKALTAQVTRPVAVTPLVVVVGAAALTVKEQPVQVRVLEASGLLRHLQRAPRTLSDAQVQELAVAAGRPTTWQQQPAPAEDPAPLLAQFTALDHEVRRARLVRTLWPLAGCAGTAVGALTVGPQLLQALLQPLLP